jgi:hypothetical protein
MVVDAYIGPIIWNLDGEWVSPILGDSYYAFGSAMFNVPGIGVLPGFPNESIATAFHEAVNKISDGSRTHGLTGGKLFNAFLRPGWLLIARF